MTSSTQYELTIRPKQIEQNNQTAGWGYVNESKIPNASDNPNKCILSTASSLGLGWEFIFLTRSFVEWLLSNF